MFQWRSKERLKQSTADVLPPLRIRACSKSVPLSVSHSTVLPCCSVRSSWLDGRHHDFYLPTLVVHFPRKARSKHSKRVLLELPHGVGWSRFLKADSSLPSHWLLVAWLDHTGGSKFSFPISQSLCLLSESMGWTPSQFSEWELGSYHDCSIG